MSITLEAESALAQGPCAGAPPRGLSQLFREYGVRRENVRLNTGSDRYAFNGLQHSLLPEEYQPPAGTYGKNVS
jgi:hypothetical protein